MPLRAGDRIGGYDIIALLGAGGMGEVYRARDARLGRDVALKILSPDIAADADAVTRFEREARVLASLNHPNIAAIYGIEAAGAGQPAIVLELVEGETLAARLARGPLPVAEALGFAMRIADALDAAHEAGIVHRDLKPGNLTIDETGRLKVLDFGLAKVVAPLPEGDPSESPTLTVRGTKHGVILGTAAYMSPEQARGRRVDKRTDIWAFGCVLYEMLTGQRAFAGETTSDLIAAIIERAPDFSRLPAATPPHVGRVLERCLHKDPKQRARDIADVRTMLECGDPVAAVAPSRVAGMIAAAAAAVLVTALAGIATWRWLAPAGDPVEPIEFTFPPPPGYTLQPLRPTVSPDGRQIAFLAQDANRRSSIWIRPLSTGAPRRIEGTEGAITSGMWSPDSASIAFLVGDSWKRVNANGGPVVTIASGIVANLGLSWGPGDTIVVAPANRTNLARVPASGGALEPLTRLDASSENSHRWPHVLPDGRHFLFTVRSDRPENLGIRVGSFDGAAARTLVNAPSPGVFARPGWLLYVTPDEALMAQPLDPATWTLGGRPEPLAAGVSYNGPSAAAQFDASLDGRVVAYLAGSRGNSTLMWLDGAGAVTGTLTEGERVRAIRLSRDGRTLAVEKADERYGTRDIWLLDTATKALTRLTTNAATDWRAVFSPDGARIAFASDRAGRSTVFLTAVSRPGGETPLYRDAGGGANPLDWSPDGSRVIVQVDDERGRSWGILAVPVTGGAAETLVQEDVGSVSAARFSPDGRRLAFVSTTTGKREVYVMSLADRQRVRVSTSGGAHPVWGRDGRALFYQAPDGAIVRAAFNRDGLSLAAPPSVRIRPCGGQFEVEPAELNFDLTADGSRFLVRCDAEDGPHAVTVLVNWQARLR